jgi:hypothetical protein
LSEIDRSGIEFARARKCLRVILLAALLSALVLRYRQHHPEARIALHHPRVGFRRARQTQVDAAVCDRQTKLPDGIRNRGLDVG